MKSFSERFSHRDRSFRHSSLETMRYPFSSSTQWSWSAGISLFFSWLLGSFDKCGPDGFGVRELRSSAVEDLQFRDRRVLTCFTFSSP